MDPRIELRTMTREDWPAVGELVHVSTNYWYEKHRGFRIFTGDVRSTDWFCRVYEALDPGCCIVAEDVETKRLAGSCFYHPRPTHVSLGIMNAHPSYFGLGVARKLLQAVIDKAAGLPVRLVSSAMNLDSFSLYTRAGFVPRQLYQDMQVPDVSKIMPLPLTDRVRPATAEDIDAMVSLERQLSGIDRRKDFAFFIENTDDIWHTLVLDGDAGLAGFLSSVRHPSSHLIGPGVARDDAAALALLAAQLAHHAKRYPDAPPVFLLPCDRSDLVRTVYTWGGRNLETHVHNVLGDFQPFGGVNFPSFMPESG